MADVEKLAKVEDDVVDGNIYPPAPADEDITVFYYPSKYYLFFFYWIDLNLMFVHATVKQTMANFPSGW